jgi:uncharacterized short protein YbdD (DUF466 family)
MSAGGHVSLIPSSSKGEEVKSSAIAIFWRTLRTLTGDDAYEKYCEHHRSHHANEPVLDQRAFYLKNQQKKWGGINRCC